MFEGGVLPRVPADCAAGTLSAPAQDASAGTATCPEDVAGLLGSLAAGGALAGVVEGLLAHLLVTTQNHNHDDSDGGGDGSGDGEDSAADGDAVPALLTSESGGDASGEDALVAGAEGHRVVSLEEVGGTGLLGLGARGLGELAAACHRLAAWATWGESLAAACLTGCAELSTHPGQWGPDGQVSEVVGYEERRFNATCLLSARLGVSRSRAGQIIDHGSALMNMGFGPTEAMERCGVLDAAKASLVTRRLGDVPAPVALAVQERVLPQAPRRSVSQVGRDIERALMETDPTGHAERVRVNQERRCVSRPRPAGEGVSQVRLLLPTMDALLLDATLDAIAASARAAGEQRTPAQLRADALGAMTLSTLRTSQQTAFAQPSPKKAEHGGQAQAEVNGSGAAVPARLLPDGVPLEGLLGALSSLVGSASPWWTPSGTGHLPLPKNIHVDVQVTVPLSSLVGLAPPDDGPTGSDDPGDGGPGKSAAATPDPLSGAASPGGRRSLPTTGARSLPSSSGRSLPGSSGGSLPEPAPAAPATLFSAAHASQPAASCSAASVSQSAASLPASLSATPAEVAEVRIGARSAAVPALTAWALAAGGTWRRLVTDPVGGTVVDVGRTRYRPPAGLADLVRARDRACVFPTCQTPAERCDIDHLTAWSQGGTTSLDNLVVLCEAHHRLKHTPGWALTKDQTTGTLSWHTPDKTVYQRHPDGTINRLPRKTGPHQHHVPGAVVPADLSKQIGPDLIDRLNTALNHTQPSNGGARLVTRGPQPGHKPGAYETTPYPQAAHTLQLAPLIDQVPPF
ncbi:HNH endonuclease [Actinomyces oris]|uniref:HNH endonuclease n=1 Tax=Actinomyces oris TaxID=544580 RepID=A0A1Q8VUR0_9ACTO|nr:HNH endonuclease signature motif containing protein [Actinomyces oris]OLO51847.1 HNH endonuclease [Actinomyces oris]